MCTDQFSSLISSAQSVDGLAASQAVEMLTLNDVQFRPCFVQDRIVLVCFIPLHLSTTESYMYVNLF